MMKLVFMSVAVTLALMSQSFAAPKGVTGLRIEATNESSYPVEMKDRHGHLLFVMQHHSSVYGPMSVMDGEGHVMLYVPEGQSFKVD